MGFSFLAASRRRFVMSEKIQRHKYSIKLSNHWHRTNLVQNTVGWRNALNSQFCFECFLVDFLTPSSTQNVRILLFRTLTTFFLIKWNLNVWAHTVSFVFFTRSPSQLVMWSRVCFTFYPEFLSTLGEIINYKSFCNDTIMIYLSVINYNNLILWLYSCRCLTQVADEKGTVIKLEQ